MLGCGAEVVVDLLDDGDDLADGEQHGASSGGAGIVPDTLREGPTFAVIRLHTATQRQRSPLPPGVESRSSGERVAEVDGNRTRRTRIARPNRFEGGGAHQVPGHLRWRDYRPLEMRPSEQRWARGAGVVGGALALWAIVMWLAARSARLPVWSSSTWDRWDSGQYLSIARDGYSFGPCIDVANRGPGDMCGNAGWFPGYPYAIRVLGWSGITHQSIGRWLSVLAFVAVLSILWFGFLAALPLATSLPAMALAAVFPAVVYDGAIFPIALTTMGMLGALAAMQRERWLLAGLCGAIAAVCYPSGLLIGVAAAVPACCA